MLAKKPKTFIVLVVYKTLAVFTSPNLDILIGSQTNLALLVKIELNNDGLLCKKKEIPDFLISTNTDQAQKLWEIKIVCLVLYLFFYFFLR